MALKHITIGDLHMLHHILLTATCSSCMYSSLPILGALLFGMSLCRFAAAIR
eukprot:COSAG04_NODE_2987_length_3311_cov_2.770548_4_plen_52_part_00